VTARDIAAARQWLLGLFRCAVAAVDGRAAVRGALSGNPLHGPVTAIALGKAAAAMLAGAVDALGTRLRRGLLVTKPGQPDADLVRDPRITCRYGDHPVPGSNSLAAGHALLDFIAATPEQEHLLFLLSGGTSSLVEVPRADIDLATLQYINSWLLASGLDIQAMNAVRQALSTLKGGRLLDYTGTRQVSALLMSDVPGDDPAVIGSGLLFPAAAAFDAAGLPDWLCELLAGATSVPVTGARVEHAIVASSSMAIAAAAAQARAAGCRVEVMPEPLCGDVARAAALIAATLAGTGPGIVLWGGETTVELPEQPGQGGRNQQLALMLVANGLEGSVVLAAGSDGDDGNNGAAGAVVDPGSLARMQAAGCGARDCLRRADAASCLGASDDLLVTGPTGTNVMDLVMAMKLADVQL